MQARQRCLFNFGASKQCHSAISAEDYYLSTSLSQIPISSISSHIIILVNDTVTTVENMGSAFLNPFGISPASSSRIQAQIYSDTQFKSSFESYI